MVILHDDEYYRNRIPEPDLGALRNFLRFIWNPDRKQLFGRSGKEWALLGFFYLCFFTILGSLFILQMWISIEYASQLQKPFFLYNSLISKSYGVNFSLFRQLDFDSPGKFSLITNFFNEIHELAPLKLDADVFFNFSFSRLEYKRNEVYIVQTRLVSGMQLADSQY